MKKKSYIINFSWCLVLLGVLGFAAFSVCFFMTRRPMWGWITVGGAILFAILSTLIPAYTRIDRKGIVIHYLPFDKEVFLKDKLDSITIEYSTAIPYIFDYFVINGEREDRYRFYKVSRISRSKRAQKLIEKHFGIKIVGFIDPGIKGYFAKRRAKMEKGEIPAVGDAPALERAARKTVRQKISAIGLLPEDIKCEYYYRTKDGEKQNRPIISHGYYVRLTDRKDGDTLSVKLTEVKNTGKALRGRSAKDAEKNIESSLERLISNNG